MVVWENKDHITNDDHKTVASRIKDVSEVPKPQIIWISKKSIRKKENVFGLLKVFKKGKENTPTT